MNAASETALGGPVSGAFLVFFAGFMSLVVSKFHAARPDFEFAGILFTFRRRYMCATITALLIVVMAYLGIRSWLLICFGLLMFGLLVETRLMAAQSWKDAQEAQTLLGTISGFFGWTESYRVASGKRDPGISFAMFIGVHAILGMVLAVAIQELL